MEAGVRKLFERYERSFNRSLGGETDMDELASFYATEFIAASPAGVMAGRNDESFRQAMTQGYARYREIGTRAMRIREVRITAIDGHHCLAHVAWTATYARQDQADITIDFDVHYLVQQLGDDPKLFGWMSGDENAVLKKHGII
ncbi:MAG: DUF4440 domain-containing protein [Novosphingobium sp.]|jgi:hypothetical protein|nr:DUF4440 domain-containing protein [Novosphingobium sp.]